MTLPVIFRPEAEADIRDTFAELEGVRPGMGSRFADRVREVLQRIESMPEMYGVLSDDVRAARLKKFRHVVYYVVFDDRIEVLGVLHGARDSAIWQSRI